GVVVGAGQVGERERLADPAVELADQDLDLREQVVVEQPVRGVLIQAPVALRPLKARVLDGDGAHGPIIRTRLRPPCNLSPARAGRSPPRSARRAGTPAGRARTRRAHAGT